MDLDVAIIGGGPAGSTVGTLLKKYRPDSRILVIEREHFPREHVGESQLPAITPILEEMGVWDQCEAAGFPVKTGAMYRWGTTDDLWKLDFLVGERYQNLPRPAALEGQRRLTTFHVDRSVYDQILLDHAESCGVQVRQGVKVTGVRQSGDQVEQLELADGDHVRAKYYVDASGQSGFLRRQLGVPIFEPSSLQNVAIWDYWTNPAWASTVNAGGVRARIFSLGYGWVWYIPLSETRSSIGLVTHRDYLKRSGQTPSAIYAEAVSEERFVSSLLEGASSLGKLASTKDWSFTASRLAGENWFLVGESGGFADPILAAGMTLAHVGGRELAHTLAALLGGEHDPDWLKSWYQELSLRRIQQHIRFADYWYHVNSHWSDLKAFTTNIASDAGLDLTPDEAFRWLSTGGFASDTLDAAAIGSYRLGSAKAVLSQLSDCPINWLVNRYNEWRLNLVGAFEVSVPRYKEGRIEAVRCYQRGKQLLPVQGYYRLVVSVLQRERDATSVFQEIARQTAPRDRAAYNEALAQCMDVIEGMLAEGWIKGFVNKKRPFVKLALGDDSVSLEDDDPFAITAYTKAGS